jgi:subtilisin family serine protease
MKRSVLALAVLSLAAPAFAGDGNIQVAVDAKVIPDSYIVVLNDDAASSRDLPSASGFTVDLVAVDMAARYNGTVFHVYDSALKGFAIKMGERAARKLAADPRVAYVEADIEMSINVTQSPATWGIDRIDQRTLPRSNSYTYTPTASNVRAYIVDTGIRATHTNFGGRVNAGAGFTAINDGRGTTDCNGHGTHVAGTVGSATYGVAKGVQLIPVRVLSCTGSGSNAGVIAGVNFVANTTFRPAVANMSLGGGISTALDNAVNTAAGRGVTFAVAAGNSNANACNSSPARAANAITVGSTTSTDARSSFSNFGTCLDIFAPGSSITSTWSTSNTATNTISGTSMASPHVAGVAALYLSTHTTASAATVRNAMVAAATLNRITNPGTGSPNRLLYSLIPQ